LGIAHVGVVVVVDVDIRDLLEVAFTGGVDDMHGTGGAGCSLELIAGGDVDLASIGGSGCVTIVIPDEESTLRPPGATIRIS